MWALRRLPARRGELLFTLIFLLACFGLAGFSQARRADELAAWLLLAALEAALPIGLGLAAAGLLAEDTALDLLLSSPRPAGQILAERLACLLALGALLGVCGQVLAAAWGVQLPQANVYRLFIWLSPLCFWLGLASLAALWRGKVLDGVWAVLAGTGAALLLLGQIPRLCALQTGGGDCPAWLLSPLMSLANPLDGYWPLNRLLWLGLGAGLLALSIQLAGREELLTNAAARE